MNFIEWLFGRKRPEDMDEEIPGVESPTKKEEMMMIYAADDLLRRAEAIAYTLGYKRSEWCTGNVILGIHSVLKKYEELDKTALAALKELAAKKPIEVNDDVILAVVDDLMKSAKAVSNLQKPKTDNIYGRTAVWLRRCWFPTDHPKHPDQDEDLRKHQESIKGMFVSWELVQDIKALQDGDQEKELGHIVMEEIEEQMKKEQSLS